MTSTAQLAANIANAQKSSGPTTDPGKQRTRLNAYRHGLTGQIHILTEKDQLAYEKHCAGIRESLAPQTPLEASIVQSIADDRWRLHRAASFEDTSSPSRCPAPMKSPPGTRKSTPLAPWPAPG